MAEFPRRGCVVWGLGVVVAMGMLLDSFPSLAVVELHPVILSILNLASIFQSLGEKIAEMVVVGGIFEAKVANIGKVLVKFI